jgi:hypothetical protein
VEDGEEQDCDRDEVRLGERQRSRGDGWNDEDDDRGESDYEDGDRSGVRPVGEAAEGHMSRCHSTGSSVFGR